MIYTPIKSDATRISALLSGDVDLVTDLPTQDVAAPAQRPQAQGARRPRGAHHLHRHGPVQPRAEVLECEPRKGSRALLEAFARAGDALGAGALLAVAGGETLFDYADYREGWERDAERLGLTVHRRPPPAGADVAVLEKIADPGMPALFRAADLLAFPSEREGFGLVVLEAQAAGLPAVVSDLPVLREILSDGRDCRMVPVDDPEALAAALVEVMGDRALRERLVAGGRATAARFTWEAAAAAHERVYEEIARVPA